MSQAYCVIAYTGGEYEIDGCRAVYGPFDREEASGVAARLNERLKTATDDEKYGDTGPFAWVAPDAFVVMELEGCPVQAIAVPDVD